MTVERKVRAFAGSIVLISLALGVQQSPIFISSYFLWVTAFVGANLLQSSFTGFCPLESMLKKWLIIKNHLDLKFETWIDSKALQKLLKTCWHNMKSVRLQNLERGHSSDGRAAGSQSAGRRFDPAWLHHLKIKKAFKRVHKCVFYTFFF